MEKMIQPTPGSYFRLGETVYKAFDDGGKDYGCNRCVFNRGCGEHTDGCAAPSKLNCKGLYFEDHTHELTEVELVDEPTTKNQVLSVAIGLVIMIVAIIYKLYL